MLELFFGHFDRWLVDRDVLVAFDGEGGKEFEDRLDVERGAVFDGQLGHLRLADGAHAQFADGLVEALGQQAVDDFLADLGGKAAADDRFRHFAGAEAGNLGVFAIVGRDFAVGLGDFFGGNVDHQFAGALGIENRAVLVVVGLLRRDRDRAGVSRFRIAFEGAAGAQHFPSVAHAPIHAATGCR